MMTMAAAHDDTHDTQAEQLREQKALVTGRTGSAPEIALVLLLIAQKAGIASLSTVQCISWLPTDTTPEKRRNKRLQYRRALHALAEKGLVIPADKALSVSGLATGSLQDYVGKRVPVGRTRIALAFSITHAGRLKAIKFYASCTPSAQRFILSIVQKLRKE
jgi:hypothetical protein